MMLPLGRIRVPEPHTNNWDELLPLMGRIVPLGVKHLPETGEVEFSGLSRMFAEIEQGTPIPLYTVVPLQQFDTTGKPSGYTFMAVPVPVETEN